MELRNIRSPRRPQVRPQMTTAHRLGNRALGGSGGVTIGDERSPTSSAGSSYLLAPVFPSRWRQLSPLTLIVRRCVARRLRKTGSTRNLARRSLGMKFAIYSVVWSCAFGVQVSLGCAPKNTNGTGIYLAALVLAVVSRPLLVDGRGDVWWQPGSNNAGRWESRSVPVLMGFTCEKFSYPTRRARKAARPAQLAVAQGLGRVVVACFHPCHRTAGGRPALGLRSRVGPLFGGPLRPHATAYLSRVFETGC